MALTAAELDALRVICEWHRAFSENNGFVLFASICLNVVFPGKNYVAVARQTECKGEGYDSDEDSYASDGEDDSSSEGEDSTSSDEDGDDETNKVLVPVHRVYQIFDFVVSQDFDKYVIALAVMLGYEPDEQANNEDVLGLVLASVNDFQHYFEGYDLTEIKTEDISLIFQNISYIGELCEVSAIPLAEAEFEE